MRSVAAAAPRESVRSSPSRMIWDRPFCPRQRLFVCLVFSLYPVTIHLFDHLSGADATSRPISGSSRRDCVQIFVSRGPPAVAPRSPRSDHRADRRRPPLAASVRGGGRPVDPPRPSRSVFSAAHVRTLRPPRVCRCRPSHPPPLPVAHGRVVRCSRGRAAAAPAASVRCLPPRRVARAYDPPPDAARTDTPSPHDSLGPPPPRPPTVLYLHPLLVPRPPPPRPRARFRVNPPTPPSSCTASAATTAVTAATSTPLPPAPPSCFFSGAPFSPHTPPSPGHSYDGKL